MKTYLSIILIAACCFSLPSYTNKPVEKPKTFVSYTLNITNNSPYSVDVATTNISTPYTVAGGGGSISVPDAYDAAVGTYVKYQYSTTPLLRTNAHWYYDTSSPLYSNPITGTSPYTTNTMFPTTSITFIVSTP